MDKIAYLEIEFFALVILSTVVPAGIFIRIKSKRMFTRTSLLSIGSLLAVISGVVAVCLQRLSTKAAASDSLFDDHLFSSEISIALYLVPLILAGLGMSLLSHVLCEYLEIMEHRSK